MSLNITEISQIILLIVYIFLGYLLFEGIRIFIGVRKLINRVETLSDIAGWFDLFRKFSRGKNKSK